ncbi:DUF1624 domain-containing protein [Aliikangiella coralliicola]|uniref:DUF1624 domain-containing protein n=1 Tax=Aliikangiella coralliicola TaxID=2592383 RepID=A0A545UG71_9GAMM|nr:heparan-alpha-glucosaminide N-acetyltransferase domain-containing protein [Aliikangiella coralliicola]TQV88474.1 DUF1624 domain-containing protein [Aliikangiella coralliicola]
MTEMSEIKHRLKSIDILRGIIIVLMALDHTRDFWGPTSFDPTDLTQSDAGWFFTRWITHYCAPLFIFLSGISAYLYGQKINSKSALRNFLLTRGLWLVFVEIIIINVSWQFAYQFIIFQVIWAIGISMIILAGLIYLPQKWIFVISLLAIGLHNALDDKAMSSLMGSVDWVWALLHHQKWVPLGADGFGLFIGYPIIPWFAVMALGYTVGAMYLRPQLDRQRMFLIIGTLLIVLFVLLRTLIGYGDPTTWSSTPEHDHYILSVLNTTKYPPSLQFLCMTLGPCFILLALLENLKANSSYFFLFRWFQNFGKVPMFFYILHVPLINSAAHIYTYFRYDQAVNFIQGPSAWPGGYEPSLMLVYGAWLAVILLLYVPCKKFGEYKWENRNNERRKAWLSYL